MKKILNVIVALSFLLTFFPFTGGQAVSKSEAAVALPHDVRSYALVYGYISTNQITEMKKFDMAVVGPEITDAQLRELQAAGVLVLCYAPTTADDIGTPYFTGLWEQDYLWVNGQKVTNADSPPDYVFDPRSTHFRQLVVNTIKNKIYSRGFDGVFLDTVQDAYYYLSTADILSATAQLIKEIHEANPAKLICQNNGWRDHINYTAPYIDFLMWEDYPYHLGSNDAWLNQKRDNLISCQNQYNFKVITLKVFGVNDYTGLQSYYSNARSYGFIPYGCWSYTQLNTYDVPPRSSTPEPPPAEPPPTEPPPAEPPPSTGTRLSHDVQSYTVVYGNLTAAQINEMKYFDMAIVGSEITDAQLKELQSAGVFVFCYVPTTSDSSAYPYYTGLWEQDYLWANGQKVMNNSEYVLDPRSAHLRQVIKDNIQDKIYARGFDGVFLATVTTAYELTGSAEIMTATTQLVKEIRDMAPTKLIVQDNGWRDHINYTAPYVDILLWEDYPYQLGTSDEWLNQKRDNLISLRDRYNFKVVTLKIINANDYNALQNYYSNARSYGFVPYGCWSVTAVNTYDIPSRSTPPVEPPSVEPPSVEPPPVEPPPVVPDTQAPTAPVITEARNLSKNSIRLTWKTSTDNVGVHHYNIYRRSSLGYTQVGTTTGTTYTDTGLSRFRYYQYYVQAVDAAGNKSIKSNTVGLITLK